MVCVHAATPLQRDERCKPKQSLLNTNNIITGTLIIINKLCVYLYFLKNIRDVLKFKSLQDKNVLNNNLYFNT